MDKVQLVALMSEAAIATQSEWKSISDGQGNALSTVDVYHQRFGSWRQDEFREAIMSAAEEANSFPTVARILKNRPKNYSTGWLNEVKKWEQEKRERIRHESQANVQGVFDRSKVPDWIREKSDDELIAMLDRSGIRDVYVNKDWHVRQIRRGSTLWVQELESVRG